MVVRIVTRSKKPEPDGASQYTARLVASLVACGLTTHRHTFHEWEAGTATGDPKQDIVIAPARDAMRIQPAYGVIAVEQTCGMERGLRCRMPTHMKVGRQQMAAATRKRTFWVAPSHWAARHCRLHTGVQVDRVIFGGVDVDEFMPSERQRLRAAKRPVVLHYAMDANSGQHLLAGIEKALKGAAELRELHCKPEEVPEAMREADMWLSLSTSGVLPMAVLEAMSSGLVVVGTSVGVLWSHTRGVVLRDGPALGWLNKEIGAVVFDWQQRDYPEVVAHHIRAAWHHRKALGKGREYARRWWSLETFGRKWVEALAMAAKRFGLKT